jgi:hypothetical protein
LGEGLLDLTVYEVASTLIIDPKLVEETLNQDFELIRTSIKSVFEECGLNPKEPFAQQTPKPTPARQAVDDVIFNALGLSQPERDDVYRAVCQLVWERTSKAKNKGA